MSENPVQTGLSLLIGVMVIGAIGLAFGGFDPNIAVDIVLPIFVIGVFAAIGFGLYTAVIS